MPFDSFTYHSNKFGDDFEVPEVLRDSPDELKTYIESERARRRELGTQWEIQPSGPKIQVPKSDLMTEIASSISNDSGLHSGWDPEKKQDTGIEYTPTGRGFWDTLKHSNETSPFRDTLPGVLGGLADPETRSNYDFRLEDPWEAAKMLGTKAYHALKPFSYEGMQDLNVGGDTSIRVPKISTMPERMAGGMIEGAKGVGKGIIESGLPELYMGRFAPREHDVAGGLGEAGLSAAEMAGAPGHSLMSAFMHPTIENIREAGTDIALASGLGAATMKGHANSKAFAEREIAARAVQDAADAQFAKNTPGWTRENPIELPDPNIYGNLGDTYSIPPEYTIDHPTAKPNTLAFEDSLGLQNPPDPIGHNYANYEEAAARALRVPPPASAEGPLVARVTPESVTVPRKAQRARDLMEEFGARSPDEATDLYTDTSHSGMGAFRQEPVPSGRTPADVNIPQSGYNISLRNPPPEPIPEPGPIHEPQAYQATDPFAPPDPYLSTAPFEDVPEFYPNRRGMLAGPVIDPSSGDVIGDTRATGLTGRMVSDIPRGIRPPEIPSDNMSMSREPSPDLPEMFGGGLRSPDMAHDMPGPISNPEPQPRILPSREYQPAPEPEVPNRPVTLQKEMEAALGELDPELAKVARERLERVGLNATKSSEFKKAARGGNDFLRQLMFESDEHALDKLGQGGKDLKTIARRIDADSAAFASKQMKMVKNAIDQIPGRAAQEAGFKEAVRHVETGTSSAKPDIQGIVDALREADRIGNEHYLQSGMKTKNPITKEVFDYKARENYFPHVYEEGFFERPDVAREFADEQGISLGEAQQILAKNKKYGYGFLDSLKSRIRDLPGYRVDADVQNQHYINMARKANIDRNLGELGNKESPVYQKLNQIGEEYGPEARNRAEEIMSRYMGKDTFQGNPLWRNFAHATTGIEAFTKLSLSSFRNLPGGVSATLTRTRVPNFIRAAGEMFTKAGRNAADEMGMMSNVWKDSARDVGIGGTPKWYGVEWSERQLRRFAALAGKHEVETLFRKAKEATNPRHQEFYTRQLQTFIMDEDIGSVLKQDKLNTKQIDRAANRMVDLTQGRADSLSLPHMWSSPNPMVNVITQFKKYAFIQSKNYKDAFFRGYEPLSGEPDITLAQKARNWNWAMLPKMAVGMSIIGEVPADLRAMIRGDKRPNFWSIARMVDNASNAFGFGLLGDALSAPTKKQGLSRLVTPPAVQDAFTAVEDAYSAGRGDFRPAVRDTLGQVPVFGHRLRDAASKKKSH